MKSSKQKFTENQWAVIVLIIGLLSGMIGYFWPKEPRYAQEYTVKPPEKIEITDENLYGSLF